MNDRNKAFGLGALSFIPMLIWWLGWFPGFLSSDSIDQLTQIETGEYTNFHPAFHTISMWLVTRVWDHPAAITLVQGMAMAAVLGLVARRLAGSGVDWRLAGGAGVIVALLPAVAPTVLTIWKDIPFTIAFLWLFAELLQLGRDKQDYWESRANGVRLGLAAALVWLFRHNGFVTVIPLAIAIAWVFRTRRREILISLTAFVGFLAVVYGPLYWAFSVDRQTAATAELMIGAVASSFVHEPGNFSESETGYLTSLAPRDVWIELYDCDNSNFILFDQRFDKLAIRNDPGPFFRLGLKTGFRDLDTVLGHQWCMTNYLISPGQPSTTFLQRPPFAIPPNALGIERNPVSDRAFQATFDVFQWAEAEGRLWLTWRPALALWGAALAGGFLLFRRIPGIGWVYVLLGIHLVNVAATSLGQQFRLAFPLYVGSLLTLPLLALARSRNQQSELVVDHRPDQELDRS